MLIKTKKLEVELMAKVNIRPLSDRVVVKPLPAEEVTKSGLVIPDTAKERPQQGGSDCCWTRADN